MLPPEVGFEVTVSANGLVEQVTGRDFVDVPVMAARQHQQHADIKSETSEAEATNIKEEIKTEQSNSSLHSSATEMRGTLHQILKRMPTNLRSKTRPLLIRLLSSCPDIDFTTKGHLVYKNQTIPNSNLTQIFTNILNPKKNSAVPGLKEVLECLKKSSNPFQHATHPKAPNPLYLKRATRAEMKKW